MNRRQQTISAVRVQKREGPEPMRIAGHSLRRGMATEVAARTNGDVKKVMEASHKMPTTNRQPA